MVYWDTCGISWFTQLLEWTFQKFPVGLVQVPHVQISKQMEQEENSLISPETMINLSKLEYFTNLDVPEVRGFRFLSYLFWGPRSCEVVKTCQDKLDMSKNMKPQLPNFHPPKKLKLVMGRPINEILTARTMEPILFCSNRSGFQKQK